ncbi:DUF4856 domain-containing protein [Gilvimarinus sp. 1_MG-2023]|uniref:DUF4856 domain-containing protein n=1 Tax=Gilvimarinus sp. 1_MG-2023 TaxID=3062638 RepID=UPI0026E20111|nr:DUF4856 domain-containing protein [Gilvimarinus sp. 1_MG-2023]MDO6746162.1 DUF4856 domain-containing protein [Gilvimarinus sp. 1_MG-2023]
MKGLRLLTVLLILSVNLVLVACGGGSSSDPEPVAEVPDPDNGNTVDEPSSGDEGNDQAPSAYQFSNAQSEDTVSYTGQTKRQILISDMVAEMAGLTEDAAADVEAQLNFYFRYDAATSDDLVPAFALDGESLLPQNDASQFTYGAIAGGKDLVGKIAGGDGAGGGETGTLVNDFFGWQAGMDTDPLPVELVDYLIAELATDVTDGVTPQIPTVTGDVPLDTVTVSAQGLDYAQLIQKFLLGAVSFSQGTGDYLQSDFANILDSEEGYTYTNAEHKWDEAFGYFGAARDYADYTDAELRASAGRVDYENGYHDTNGDGLIDIRSEYNFGNSVNCAKRDVGTAGNPNPTDFTQEAFDAFVAGRHILAQASAAGEMTTQKQNELDIHISTAAVVWEKCIAATVVHYINDVIADMGEFENGKFASLDNFKNLAKHWGEMKGFALGLQFSPESPFAINQDSVDSLRLILNGMGDAPVLADGTQAGVAFSGGTDEYIEDLTHIRNLLRSAYGFDEENVESW